LRLVWSDLPLGIGSGPQPPAVITIRTDQGAFTLA